MQPRRLVTFYSTLDEQANNIEEFFLRDFLDKVGNSVLLSGHENCYQGHLTPWVMEVADR